MIIGNRCAHSSLPQLSRTKRIWHCEDCNMIYDKHVSKFRPTTRYIEGYRKIQATEEVIEQ